MTNGARKGKRPCGQCGTEASLHGRGLCRKCYFKEHNQRPEVKRRKLLWQKAYYAKHRDAIRAAARLRPQPKPSPEKLRQYRRNARHKKRFGGNRGAVLARDNYRCQVCGAAKNLVVHHQDGANYRKNTGTVDNSMNNLITLCSRCHTSLHSKAYAEAFGDGFGRSRTWRRWNRDYVSKVIVPVFISRKV